MTYVSTFIAGTKNIVSERLKQEQRARILGLYDSLVLYETPSNSSSIAKLRYLNNSFILIKKLQHHKSFEHAINEICRLPNIPDCIGSNKQNSFRIIFSEENNLVAVPEYYRHKAERFITFKTKLSVSRSKPDVEFWVMKDRANSYFAQRITTKNASKGLLKGQLRPELADMLCYLSTIRKNDVVFDPFCGYGSILKAARHYSPKKIIGSDINPDCIDFCHQALLPLVVDGGNKKTVLQIEQRDIFSQMNKQKNKIEKNTVDKIITDPPWGIFGEKIDPIVFYIKMFDVMKYILKDKGVLVILMARDIPLKGILRKTGGLSVLKSYEILVNGKKANIYILIKETAK